MSKEITPWKPTAAIKKFVASAEKKLALAQAHVVDSIETYEYVDKDLTVIAADLKKLEALEVLAVGELKAVVKERVKFFAAAKKQFKEAKDLLRSKMAAYNRRQEAVARDAQEAATKAAIEQDMPAPTILPATPKGNTTYRDKWEAEIVDFGVVIEHIAKHYATNPKLLDMILPNTSVLNAIANTVKKEGKMIPGINIVNNRIAIT